MSDSNKQDFKGRILVVDDEPYTLDLVKLTLTTAGFHVVTAAGGDEALQLLDDFTFDLLLLDVMMPEVSGFDVLRQLQAVATIPPPVIIFSAMGTTDAKQIGEKLGAIGYLVKPVSRGALLDSVHSALGLSADEYPPD